VANATERRGEHQWHNRAVTAAQLAWHDVERLLTIAAWVMLGCVIAVVLALRGPNLKPLFALFERLFYLSSFVWFFTVAINLARSYG
jgi:hypothetical protein